MNPKDEPWFQLWLRWWNLPYEWEVRTDGKVRVVRDQPANFTEAEVAMLCDHLGKEPFPRRSDPSQVKRYLPGDYFGTLEIGGVFREPEPAAPPPPNPAAERIASVARVLDEQARERDPVLSFRPARVAAVDPWGEEDPFA